jgi:hypothetical protein
MMTQHDHGQALDMVAVQAFAAGLRGELIRRNDAGYDAARRVYNGAFRPDRIDSGCRLEAQRSSP